MLGYYFLNEHGAITGGQNLSDHLAQGSERLRPRGVEALA